jgi:hypothetical protein
MLPRKNVFSLLKICNVIVIITGINGYSALRATIELVFLLLVNTIADEKV